MKFSVLASGSRGNCTLVSEGSTTLLIDCGISCKQTTLLLRQHNLDPASLSGICITHDHTDHICGLRVLLKQNPGIPLYATAGTCAAICDSVPTLHDADWHILTPSSDFSIGCVTLHPFATSHDAAESVGYILFNEAGRSLGYATDLGYAPALLQTLLSGCEALVLESNHDPMMLRNSGRPWGTIERIAGISGHLSNEQSAELVDSFLDASPLHTLVLAHLSGECNSREEALGTHRLVLNRHHRADSIRLLAATQNAPTPFLEV